MSNIHLLTGLDTIEVSLVENGANRRRIAITKSEGDMDEDVRVAVMQTPAEGESEFVESLKSAGIDEKKIEASVANFRLQKGFKDLLDSEDLARVTKAAGYEVTKAKKKEEEEEDDDKKPAFLQGKKKEAKKGLETKGMDPEVKTQVEALWKSNEDLKVELRKERDQREDKEYLEKAKGEYSLLGESENLGKILKSLNNLDEKSAKDVEGVFKLAQERIEKGDLFSEVGSGRQVTVTKAEDLVEAAAQELVSKSENLTVEAAKAFVLQTNPKLYDEYNSEKEGK